jgi:hypothetical protein
MNYEDWHFALRHEHGMRMSQKRGLRKNINTCGNKSKEDENEKRKERLHRIKE